MRTPPLAASSGIRISSEREPSDGGAGLYVLDLIQRGALIPDYNLYRKLLKECSRLGKVEEGLIVHANLFDSHFWDDHLVLRNTKCGCLDNATKDMVTWTALITGYSQNDQPRDALLLFPQMLRLGFHPITSLFPVLSKLLRRYMALTQVSKFMQCASSMVTNLIFMLEVLSWTCMLDVALCPLLFVDLSGRVGLLDRAERFIREMPIEPTAAVYGALPGACTMHKNAEFGVYTAERAIELRPHDSGVRMLLLKARKSAG